VARNFALELQARARAAPDRPALVGAGGHLGHGELDARAAGLAARLRERGVGPGARLALVIDNGPEFAVALLAGLRLGATVAPIDPRLTDEERALVLADLAPALVLGPPDAAEGGWGGPDPVPEVDAPALILYTSGSTGRPKGAIVSHPAVDFAVRSWAGPVMALDPADVVLAVLPLSHSFGLNGALLAPLLAGATAVLLERFTADGVIAAAREHGVTVFPAVATMYRRLLDAPGLGGGLGRLRLAVSGAAPCPWELACAWRERTGVRILRGYGMTELFRPISYLADEADEVPAAIGRAVPGVELRVVDEAGREAPAGTAGELWIRTPAVMDGYLGAPDDTRVVLVAGWFRTGDLAVVDARGYVRIVGRTRERILRGGYSVFPSEVESTLLAHPAVSEAAVVGVPHDELGEEVAAFVALEPGATAGPEELIAYCRERLAAFKWPRRLTILPRLPKTATGKVLKARLITPR
jgi:long-chain acyl-CoA synthetase